MDILDLPKKFHNRIYVASTGCWVSTFYHKPDGYAQFSECGKCIRLHRWVYEILVGKIPDGLFACHKCDNPGCCNPRHIFLGTSGDNMLDASRKGRRRPRPPSTRALGEKNGRSKFTFEKIRDIRQEYESGASSFSRLAKKYQTTSSNISYIVNGKTWNRLGGSST